MVAVFADDARDLHANKRLQLFPRLSVQFHEVSQHTQHGRLFLRLFRQTVNELNNFLEVRIHIVSDKQLTISEDFSNEFPTMHAILNILNEEVEVLHEDELVFLVITDKLDQKYVGLFEHF